MGSEPRGPRSSGKQSTQLPLGQETVAALRFPKMPSLLPHLDMSQFVLKVVETHDLSIEGKTDRDGQSSIIYGDYFQPTCLYGWCFS